MTAEAGDVTLASYQAAAGRYRDQERPRDAAVLAFLDRMAELVPGGQVLELGSGTGTDAAYLEGRGIRVTRTDAVPAFVEMLRHGGNEARLLDVRREELDGPHDGVLAMAMLLHLTRREFEVALGKAWRAVRDGGVLAFTVKEGDGDAWSEAKLGLPRHFTYWREPEVRRHMERSGWSILSVDHVMGRVEPWLHVLARRQAPAG